MVFLQQKRRQQYQYTIEAIENDVLRSYGMGGIIPSFASVGGDSDRTDSGCFNIKSLDCIL